MIEPTGRAAYGAIINRCFDLPKPSTLYFETLGATVSLVESDTISTSFSSPMPYDDAFVLIIRLKAGVPFQLWIDGKFMPSGELPTGSHSVLDQRTSPYCLGFGACRHVQFHFPRPALNALALEEGFAPIEAIDYRKGFARPDPALAHLAAIFESLLRGEPGPGDRLMASYLAVAVASRFINQHGQRLPERRRAKTLALSSRQMNLAKTRLVDSRDSAATVFELAALCQLPVNTFIKAFRGSVGTSPPIWLRRRQLDQAINLMKRRALDLPRIAIASGFGNTDRMEADFMTMLGHPPDVFFDEAAASRYWRH